MKLRLTILFCLLATVAWPQSNAVLITEFMAQNTATLRDETGARSDWIELFNSGTNEVNLAGWYLTDNAANLVKWRFPATNLPSHAFLVVFASGTNRAIPGRPLHTSFSLSASGEYLGLVQPDGLTIASEFAPYPRQTANVSFGLPMHGFQLLSTVAVPLSPTPGTNNDQALSVPGPVVSEVFHSPLTPQDDDDIIVTARIVPLSAPVGLVTLTYRVMFDAEVNVPMFDDGAHQDAAAGDGIYGARIPASVSTNGQMVRWFINAGDTGAGVSRYPPFLSTNDSEEYFGTAIQDPALNHPAPVLQWFISATDAATLNGTTAVRCSLYWNGELYDNVRFARVRDDSLGFAKGSYNIDFNSDHHFLWDEREKRVNDIHWVTTYTDKAHMRTMLSYGVYADAGPRSPHHFVVPVRVQSNANFYGTVHLVEQGDDNFLERIGRDKHGAFYEMHFDPSLEANAEKKTRLDEDKSDFRALIGGLNSLTNLLYIYDNIDLSEVINFFAAMVVTANVNCCHKDFYLYRDSDGDGEWEMMPWELDLTFGRNWQSGETYWDDRVYPNNGLFAGGTFPLGPILFNNATTRSMYLRRVRTLQDKLLQTNGTFPRPLNFEKQIDQWAALLTPDALLDLQKWGTWGGGRANLFPGTPTYTQYLRTLPEAAAELKTNYLPNRRAFVFGQKMNLPAEFPDAQPDMPVVLFGAIESNPASGNQNEEYIQLINTNSFAVDISGWHLSGVVEHTFQGGVVIPGRGSNNTLYVVPDKKAFRQRAASPRGGQGLYVEGPYSGRLPARGGTIYLIDDQERTLPAKDYYGNPSAPLLYLRVTEIMYHPALPPTVGSAIPEDLQFIELMNVGPVVLDLTGVQLTNGVFFSFTGAAITNLNPGQRVVVVKNLDAFRSVYGGTVPVAGVFTGTLANEGYGFRLEDGQGDTILDLFYFNDWYPITDGVGFSLVIVNSNLPPEAWSSSTNWRPSARQGGSPGAPDPPSGAIAPVLINEVLSNAESPSEDAIELYNPTAAEVDVSGWWLSDDRITPKKFRIPDGTFIPAKGFLAFDEHNFNSDIDSGGPAFSFKSGGDEVYLFAGDASGNLLNYMHGFVFGASDPDVSFGRYITTIGQEHFVAQVTNTMLSSNAGPRVGPVVISEIMYHPPEIARGGVLFDNTADEYIELHNITDQPVPLYYTNFASTNAWLATNTWRLDKGVNFNFPTGFVMVPHGYVLVVKFDPRRERDTLARFRERFSVPPGVPILGPYDQKLSNSGESLELSKPGRPLDAGVPYISMDQVDYSAYLPWPQGIEGVWRSLNRLDDHVYGNDPTNWTAAGPSAGAAYVVGGAPPSIITQPENTIGVFDYSASFALNVAGTPPFLYQWLFNGTNLSGANGPILTLSNLQANQAGLYRCAVVNPSGIAFSSSATLTLAMPVRILIQPQPITLRGSSNVVDYGNTTNDAMFVVQAAVTGPVNYQWRFNGMTIPGAVGTNLHITNVQLANDGNYDVLITDNASTISSAPARLSVLITPTIVQAPLTQTVPAGSRLNLSVAIKGNPPPFGYQWRSNSLVLPLIISESKTNFFSITTATNEVTATYRVVITNAAYQGLGVSAPFNITTVADTDFDGLPDIVEMALGLDPNNPADALLDLDHDGVSNRDEYIAGTDPRDAASYLKVDRLTVAGSVRIEFLAVSNRTYAVEATSELTGGHWTRVAEVVASATNRLVEVLDPMPATASTQRVYRLVTPRGP